MKLLKQAQKGTRLQIAEIKIQHVNGSISTVLWNSAPVLGADRKTIIEIIAQGQDITDRKLAEDSLRETNEYLENLFSYANAPIIVWDTNYNITRFNTAFEILTGRNAGEVIGHSIKILFPEDSVDSSMKILKQAQKGERLEVEEIKIIHANGTVRTVIWNSAPVYGTDGKTIIEIIAQGQDITDRKIAEDELDVYRIHLEELITKRTADLAKAVSNLEHSNKELEEFAYVASHDLQEPLRMVSSYTQLLERRYKDKLDQDANDFIQYAVDGANRMQKLINDLLDYSRVSSQGKVFLQVDSSQALGQAVSNLQTLISDSMAMVTNEELPVLNIDESQIVRVFQNLIENAIKYKKKTELPKIHISCKKKNNLYVFAVTDNGMGIDMQYHDRIFIIFQRLHRKDEYPGTGIGLSITKRIIERHGGTIWFESKKDEGTTFFFTIPE
jgi:PAS domain S-box-containing protein